VARRTAPLDVALDDLLVIEHFGGFGTGQVTEAGQNGRARRNNEVPRLLV
jgi:hypothetical protein